MKKLIIYFVLGATLLATALFQTLPVAIASNSTTRANAQFIATIRVTNNGSAVSDVVGVLNLSTQSLIDGNFVNFNFTDSAFLTNAGGDTGFMPAASGSTFVLWSVYVPSIIGPGGVLDYKLHLGGGTDMEGQLAYFPALGGMTTVDSDTLELGNNFTIEQIGFFNTTAGNNKGLVFKGGAFSTFIPATDEIASLLNVNAWEQVAPQLGAETRMRALAVYNGRLYGGTGSLSGALYRWDDVNIWEQVAPQLGAEVEIFSLAVYNGRLYGGTGNLGNLYRWNDTNAWEQVAPQLGAETQIFSLAVYNGRLYGGTGSLGKLYKWDDISAWEEVAPQLAAEIRIWSLAVYNGRLYGGTGALGNLYRWNDTNAWEQVAPQLGAEARIFSLAVYNGRLYGGTGNLVGNLYRWDDVNIWEQVAPQLGAETQILSLAVYNGRLYGGTGSLSGALYRWDDVNIWEQVAPQLGAETGILSLAVFNGRLYGGTEALGNLYRLQALVVTATGVSSDEYAVKTTADTIDLKIFIDGIEKASVALAGAFVPNNAFNWTFLQNNSVPFLESQVITINNTIRQIIEWQNSETVFTDSSGFGNDAFPTFRNVTSNLDVTMELIAFVPVSPAVASNFSISAPSDMIGPVIEPSALYNETVGPIPGAPFIEDVMAGAGIPTTMFYVPLLLLGLCIVGLVVGKFSLLAQLIIMAIIIFAAGGIGVPAWIGLLFIIVGLAPVLASRQAGW